MRRCLLILMRWAVLIASALGCQSTFGQVAVKSSDRPVYINRVYGFRVLVPGGVTYTRAVPPNPDHGLGITMGQAKIWVDASYSDSATTEEESARQSEDCRVTEKVPARLGDRLAMRIRFSCAANAFGGAYEESLVLLVYKNKDMSPVCYEVGVRTEGRPSTPREEEIFRKLVDGFTFSK